MTSTVKTMSYVYSINILQAVNESNGKEKTFTDIYKELKIAHTSIYRTLTSLTEQNLVKKNGKRYSITEKGERALKIAQQIQQLNP